MKRSQIKIENKDIVAYCKKENSFQQKVYQKKVNLKTMSELVANRNYLIIRELREVAELLEKRNISWKEFRKMLEALPVQKVAKQGSLRFPS